MTDDTTVDDGSYRIYVDQEHTGGSKPRLKVAGFPTLMLTYQMIRQLQRARAEIAREYGYGVLEHNAVVGEAIVEDNTATVEWFSPPFDKRFVRAGE